MTARWSRLIATEEAFAFPEYFDAVRRLAPAAVDALDIEALTMILGDDPDEERTRRRLCALGAERLAAQDADGIDAAVLSLVSPGVQIFPADIAEGLAGLANDCLAEACHRSPRRLAGLATFTPQRPASAAKEIERAITKLGLAGVLVNSHTGGEYLDDPKFSPILEAASALDVALYIHPRNPPAELRRLLTTGTVKMSEVLWGFHMETALHAARLIVGGVFERFPKLRVVLGHLGEGLPALLWRLDWAGEGRFPRRASEVFRENFWMTTSGIFDHPHVDPMIAHCAQLFGSDRILFATDDPFADAAEAVRTLAKSSLPDDVIERIARTNVERVFRLPEAMRTA